MTLANNRIYNLDDRDTRLAIEKDILRHFFLYKEISGWQNKVELNYDLRSLPLVPRIMWVGRTRYFELENVILTYPYYREFVESIDSKG